MASSRESPRRRAMQCATNRGTDDEDEDRGYVWLCERQWHLLWRENQSLEATAVLSRLYLFG